MNLTKHIMNSKSIRTHSIQHKWTHAKNSGEKMHPHYSTCPKLTAAASLPANEVTLTLPRHRIKWRNVYQDVIRVIGLQASDMELLQAVKEELREDTESCERLGELLSTLAPAKRISCSY